VELIDGDTLKVVSIEPVLSEIEQRLHSEPENQ